MTELPLERDDIRFVLPTTVSPRYAPAEDLKGVGQPKAHAVSPPIAWSVPYGLELEVQLEMSSAIRGVESPSHPISVEIDSNQARVRLGGREMRMDSDFVLLVKLAEPHEPQAWLETKGTDSVTMVSFQPSFAVSDAPSEAIFLVDRSGSMQGSSIAEARNALFLERSLGHDLDELPLPAIVLERPGPRRQKGVVLFDEGNRLGRKEGGDLGMGRFQRRA